MRKSIKYSDLKADDKICPDSYFGCMEAGVPLEVFNDNEGLYVKCDRGSHYLDIQRDIDDNLIGFIRG